MTPQEIFNLTGISASTINYAATALSIRLDQVSTNQEMRRLAAFLRANGGYSVVMLERLESIVPGALITELKALSFVDRLAQLGLAVLYSASHIEVMAFVGPKSGANPRHAEIAGKKEAINNTLAAARAKCGILLDAIDVATFTGLPIKGIEYALTSLQIGFRSISGRDLNRIGMFLKQHGYYEAKALIALDILGAGGCHSTEILVRGDLQEAKENVTPVTPVSEIDYDTAATAIIKERGSLLLVMACNFKRRKMKVGAEKMSWEPGPNHASFDYIDFGCFTEATIARLQSELAYELNDVRRNGDDELKLIARAIKQCRIIGTAKRPATEKENAGPHAEMQVLNYCRSIDKSEFDLHVGVSRACCPNCALKFDEAKVKYTRKHDIIPSRSWDDPNTFETKELHVFNV